jgi:hypothetical protein
VGREVREGAGGWHESWIDPSLWSALRPEAEASELTGLLTEIGPGVYTFPLFTETYCTMLLDEFDHYRASGLPITRPNSMNNYGLIVNEIGLEKMMTLLQQQFLQPVAAALFPTKGGLSLDEHHTFVVQYRQGDDAGLDMHTDDSDVTFNVCLGKVFTGAGLTFCGSIGTPGHRTFDLRYKHVVGRCVVHLGTKRHGADDIQTGERNNLIIWNKSRSWRQTDAFDGHQKGRYEQEAGPPDAVCLSYTHDVDYGVYKKYPHGTHDPPMGSRAWCPPTPFKHDYDPNDPKGGKGGTGGKSMKGGKDGGETKGP